MSRGYCTVSTYIYELHRFKAARSGLYGFQRSTSFFSLTTAIVVVRCARRNANCSLHDGSYGLVAKLNFCALNSFGVIISWYRSLPRACFLHVCCIMAKFDVYEFLTFNAIYKRRILSTVQRERWEIGGMEEERERKREAKYKYNMNIYYILRIKFTRERERERKLIVKLKPRIYSATIGNFAHTYI